MAFNQSVLNETNNLSVNNRNIKHVANPVNA